MPKIKIQLTNEQFLAFERHAEEKGFSSIPDLLIAVSDVLLDIERMSIKILNIINDDDDNYD